MKKLKLAQETLRNLVVKTVGKVPGLDPDHGGSSYSLLCPFKKK
jgi:hypothetical protein